MCNCIDQLNELFEENDLNAKVSTPSILNGKLKAVGVKRAMVNVTKLDKSKRTQLPEITADFCPFCGESYS